MLVRRSGKLQKFSEYRGAGTVEFIVELLAQGWTEQQILDNYRG